MEMEIPNCKKFANIYDQISLLCKIVVKLCIYLCWGLVGPDRAGNEKRNQYSQKLASFSFLEGPLQGKGSAMEVRLEKTP